MCSPGIKIISCKMVFNHPCDDIRIFRLRQIQIQDIDRSKSSLLDPNQPISGRVDRKSATEAVDSGSIPGRVKPKTIKIGIHSFPA